jgi:transposase
MFNVSDLERREGAVLRQRWRSAQSPDKTEPAAIGSALAGRLENRRKEPIMAKNLAAEIRKATRRKFNAEDKIRIVLEELRGQISVWELSRREGIAPIAYYRWSKDFLEAGRNGLPRDTHRDATAKEVKTLKAENEALKRGLAEAILDVMRLKKTPGHLRRRCVRMNAKDKLEILRTVESSASPVYGVPEWHARGAGRVTDGNTGAAAGGGSCCWWPETHARPPGADRSVEFRRVRPPWHWSALRSATGIHWVVEKLFLWRGMLSL